VKLTSGDEELVAPSLSARGSCWTPARPRSTDQTRWHAVESALAAPPQVVGSSPTAQNASLTHLQPAARTCWLHAHAYSQNQHLWASRGTRAHNKAVSYGHVRPQVNSEAGEARYEAHAPKVCAPVMCARAAASFCS
jgi:hypothetical protein